MAAWAGYDLITVRNPVDDIVAAVLGMLTRRLAVSSHPYAVQRGNPTLIRRGSAALRGALP